jgi:uncharacterized DUF497 family protein
MSIPMKLGIQDYEFRVVIGRTKIDYDQDKEDANRENHGYSLESAVHLLERFVLPLGNQPPYVVSDAFMENEEIRHMHMSVDDCGDVVLMVTTMRSDETVRVISFRRAHKGERQQFQELTGYAKCLP